jgi:hypothetical protein
MRDSTGVSAIALFVAKLASAAIARRRGLPSAPVPVLSREAARGGG